MQYEHSETRGRESEEPNRGAGPRNADLVVIEPDVLTRWSLTTYLGQWFCVFAAASVAEGLVYLATRTPDSAVLSDALDPAGLATLESALRRKNPSATIIRLVTNPVGTGIGLRPEMIEKPFRLSEIARMLHAPGAD